MTPFSAGAPFRLGRADLSGTTFESRELPNVSDIQYARNFSEMTLDSSPIALFTLRESFKKSGLFGQEREITYAIKHNQTQKDFKKGGLASKIESAFNFVFSESTTKWGMVPGRALCIMGVLLSSLPSRIPLLFAAREGLGFGEYGTRTVWGRIWAAICPSESP